MRGRCFPNPGFPPDVQRQFTGGPALQFETLRRLAVPFVVEGERLFNYTAPPPGANRTRLYYRAQGTACILPVGPFFDFLIVYLGLTTMTVTETRDFATGQVIVNPQTRSGATWAAAENTNITAPLG
jgi:hypothetical protein